MRTKYRCFTFPIASLWVGEHKSFGNEGVPEHKGCCGRRGGRPAKLKKAIPETDTAFHLVQETSVLAEPLSESHETEQTGPEQKDRTRLGDRLATVPGDHRDAAVVEFDSERLAEGVTKDRFGRSNGRQYVQVGSFPEREYQMSGKPAQSCLPGRSPGHPADQRKVRTGRAYPPRYPAS